MILTNGWLKESPSSKISRFVEVSIILESGQNRRFYFKAFNSAWWYDAVFLDYLKKPHTNIKPHIQNPTRRMVILINLAKKKFSKITSNFLRESVIVVLTIYTFWLDSVGFA